MTPFELPGNLTESLATPGGPERRRWVAALPGIVADLAQRWSLQVGGPFQPGGQCAWVAPVRDPAGQDLVLKVGWPHPEALHEAAGLAVWAGDGAVVLHAAQALEHASALLLERCVPGSPLSRRPEPEQDTVVAALLRRLWRVVPGDPHPFRPLQVMCDQWADDFDRRAARAPAGLDAGISRTGIQLWRTLPATAARTVLLATDLHAGNILAAQREPWLVIDPKPYLGDPTYDAVQHMLNCAQRLNSDPLRFATRLADLLELDRDRLMLWLFARCVQESRDDPELAELAIRLAPR